MVFAAHFCQSEICNRVSSSFFWNSTGVSRLKLSTAFTRSESTKSRGPDSKEMSLFGGAYPTATFLSHSAFVTLFSINNWAKAPCLVLPGHLLKPKSRAPVSSERSVTACRRDGCEFSQITDKLRLMLKEGEGNMRSGLLAPVHFTRNRSQLFSRGVIMNWNRGFAWTAGRRAQRKRRCGW